jgi:VanZ family protein
MPSKQNRLSAATLSRFALVGFALILLVATHLPPRSPLLPPEKHGLDKALHFTAYAILAGLIATAWQLSTGILTARHLHWVWCAVAVFGALDEITQIPARRDCSIWDWSADALGAATGLLLFVWVRKRLSSRANEVQ